MIPGPQQQPGATEGRPGVVLTVCIFTYKRSHLLAKTLRAFQAQIAALGVDDLEVVVSDNASPDDTEAVAKSFTGAFPHFQYFRQSENIGLVRNYLRAVQLARGRYVWPFSDDDIPVDGAVGRFRDLAIQGQAKFYLGNFSRFSTSTGAVVVDRTLSLESDIPFSSIVTLAARVGLFETLTLVSAAIFERARFLAIDHEAFLTDETWFAHVYMLLEAFATRDCLLLADPIVLHNVEDGRWQGQWREASGRSHLYLHSLGTLRGVRILRERGLVPPTFLADVQEPELVSTFPRIEATSSTAVALLRYLANFIVLETEERRSLSGEEWQLVHQEFALLNRPELFLLVRQINFAAERLRVLQQLYDADISLLHEYFALK